MVSQFSILFKKGKKYVLILEKKCYTEKKVNMIWNWMEKKRRFLKIERT